MTQFITFIIYECDVIDHTAITYTSDIPGRPIISVYLNNDPFALNERQDKREKNTKHKFHISK